VDSSPKTVSSIENGTSIWALLPGNTLVRLSVALPRVLADNFYAGYAPTTFPGLTEAILFDEDHELAEHEAARLTSHIENLAESL
jgi:hypothetical protein